MFMCQHETNDVGLVKSMEKDLLLWDWNEAPNLLLKIQNQLSWNLKMVNCSCQEADKATVPTVPANARKL